MGNESKSEINIIYDIDKGYKNEINIFGDEFIKNNKNKCKMIIDNKEYEITNKFNVENYNNNRLKIKLKKIYNITNMSYMFSGCSSLLSLPDISKWNTNNITDISHMFSGYILLYTLPDISNWVTDNATNMNYMFSGCLSLTFLPDI